jgi:hypothetical protein
LKFVLLLFDWFIRCSWKKTHRDRKKEKRQTKGTSPFVLYNLSKGQIQRDKSSLAHFSLSFSEFELNWLCPLA